MRESQSGRTGEAYHAAEPRDSTTHSAQLVAGQDADSDDQLACLWITFGRADARDGERLLLREELIHSQSICKRSNLMHEHRRPAGVRCVARVALQPVQDLRYLEFGRAVLGIHIEAPLRDAQRARRDPQAQERHDDRNPELRGFQQAPIDDCYNQPDADNQTQGNQPDAEYSLHATKLP